MNPHRIRVLLICLAGLLAGAACDRYTDPAIERDFLKSLGQTSITVFPTYIRQGGSGSYDSDAALEIGDFFRGERLAEVSISQDRVPISGPWRMNQSKMFRQSSDEFATHLRAHPVQTQYALLAEYLMSGKGKVGGIHCYILRSDGARALGILLNSHWSQFSDASPKSVKDCTGIVIRVLRERFRPGY